MEKNEYEHYQMQDAMQQGQLDNQTAMMAPDIHERMQQTQAILVEQTNPKKIVKDIMLRLRGLEEKEDGTLVQIASPKLNKKGQENVWFILESHINQNVILSHLKDTEIATMIESLSSDLVDDLSLNWKEYGINHKTDLDAVNNSILYNIFIALKRAEGQNEKNWLSKISVENISNAARLPPMKKEGFWSKFRL